MFRAGDTVERDLDGLWFEAEVRDVHLPPSRAQQRALDEQQQQQQQQQQPRRRRRIAHYDLFYPDTQNNELGVPEDEVRLKVSGLVAGSGGGAPDSGSARSSGITRGEAPALGGRGVVLVGDDCDGSGGSGGGGGITISNNSNNRVLTGDGSNANAETKLTFDGTTLALGAETTASFQRINAQVISASVVEVDASTLKIGGTAVNKTLVDNIKQTFSDSVAQTAQTVTTTAATGSFTGHVSSSKFILSEQTTSPTPTAGGMIFSGSAFYLGFE